MGALGLVACNGLIGVRDVFFEESDATSPSDDAAVTTDGASDGSPPVSGDGGVVDATVDAAIDSALPDGGGDSQPPADAAADSDAGADDAGDGATCVANLDNDPAHCGRCGHSCLGGTCSGGRCQPVALVMGIAPWGLGFDDTRVYYGDTWNDKVEAITKDGSQRTTVADATDSVSTPFGLVVTSRGVFWINRDDAGEGPIRTTSIMFCPLGPDCGGGNPQILFAGNADAGLAAPYRGTGVALIDDDVFWVENYGERVGRVKVDGGGASLLYDAYDNQIRFPFAITSVGSSVYVMDEQGGTFRYPRDYVYDGGPAPRFAAKTLPADFISSGGGLLFWTTNDYSAGFDSPPGALRVLAAGAAAGSTAGLIATGTYLLGVGSDGVDVYWTELGLAVGTGNNATYPNGKVHRCPISGCPVTGPETLATGQAWPRRIVVDDRAIYWSNGGLVSGQGALMKLAK